MGRRDLGRVRRKEDRARASQDFLERKERYEGKEDDGVFYALLKMLKEMGWIDDAWWHAARRSDRPFVKEGRAIVPPASWDEIRFTASRRGAILITRVDFSFPEPIGRQDGRVTLRYRDQENMLNFQTTESSGELFSVYDTLLHDRFLIHDGKMLAFRMTNTNVGANALFDFVIRGRIIGGGHRIRIK